MRIVIIEVQEVIQVCLYLQYRFWWSQDQQILLVWVQDIARVRLNWNGKIQLQEI